MEDVFRRVLLELGVPHEAHSVRVMRGVVTVVVRGQHELRMGRRPVETRDAAAAGPSLVVERADQGETRV